jgi:TrpR family transcriptional regulator, trp operon repressor
MNEENDLIRTISGITEPDKMKKLFYEIFTQNERKDLMLRWKLMKMLKKGIPQRKIAADLGISLCKITRGAKILRDPDSITNRLI